MAGTREWFETVAEAQRRGKKRLPRSVYMALVAGAEQGVTLKDNMDAFSEPGFRPHIADPPAERTQATTVMGQVRRASIHNLVPDDVIVPKTFTRDVKR
jgi:hypothetical protein